MEVQTNSEANAFNHEIIFLSRQSPVNNNCRTNYQLLQTLEYKEEFFDIGSIIYTIVWCAKAVIKCIVSSSGVWKTFKLWNTVC